MRVTEAHIAYNFLLHFGVSYCRMVERRTPPPPQYIRTIPNIQRCRLLRGRGISHCLKKQSLHTTRLIWFHSVDFVTLRFMIPHGSCSFCELGAYLTNILAQKESKWACKFVVTLKCQGIESWGTIANNYL